MLPTFSIIRNGTRFHVQPWMKGSVMKRGSVELTGWAVDGKGLM